MFFVKQKTAYEMRISDWSSDVCSSDLILADTADQMRNHGASIAEEQRHAGAKPYLLPDFNLLGFNYRMTDLQGALGLVQLQKLERFISERSIAAGWYRDMLGDIGRSEEHTSELQSLMSISYAVFCLK